jgi:hypothetical protein
MGSMFRLAQFRRLYLLSLLDIIALKRGRA